MPKNVLVITNAGDLQDMTAVVLTLAVFGLAPYFDFPCVLAPCDAASAAKFARKTHGSMCLMHVISADLEDNARCSNEVLTHFQPAQSQGQLHALCREIDRHEGRLIGSSGL